METLTKDFKIRIEAKAKNAALVNAREELNLNLSNAAKLIKIQPSRLSAYELKREYPTESMAEKISDFLGKSPEELFPKKLKYEAKRHPSTFIFDRYIPKEKLISLNTNTKLLPAYSIEDEVLNEIDGKRIISDLFGILDKRERKILEYRFGFNNGKPETLEKVGKRFHLTRERIRQIEVESMGKLKDYAKNKGYHNNIPSLFEHYSHQKDYFHL